MNIQADINYANKEDKKQEEIRLRKRRNIKKFQKLLQTGKIPTDENVVKHTEIVDDKILD